MPESPYLQVALPRVNPRIRWTAYLDTPLPAVNPRINFDYNYLYETASHATSSIADHHSHHNSFHPFFASTGPSTFIPPLSSTPALPSNVSAVPHLFLPSLLSRDTPSPPSGYLLDDKRHVSDDAGSDIGRSSPSTSIGAKRRHSSIGTEQATPQFVVHAAASGDAEASGRRTSKRRKTTPRASSHLDIGEQWIYPAPSGEPGKTSQGGHSLPKELEQTNWSKREITDLRDCVRKLMKTLDMNEKAPYNQQDSEKCRKLKDQAKLEFPKLLLHEDLWPVTSMLKSILKGRKK